MDVSVTHLLACRRHTPHVCPSSGSSSLPSGDLYRLLRFTVFLIVCLAVVANGNPTTAVAENETPPTESVDQNNVHLPLDSAAGGNLTSQHREAAHNEALVFIRQLFHKYGNKRVMTYEGFEHLLENIGLAAIHIDDHHLDDHHVEGTFKEFHPDHNHVSKDHDHDDHDGHHHDDDGHHHDDRAVMDQPVGENLPSTNVAQMKIEEAENCTETKVEAATGGQKRNVAEKRGKKKRRKEKTRAVRAVGESEEPPKKCLSAREIIEMHEIPLQEGISPEDFLHICPSIIYQMDTHLCPLSTPCRLTGHDRHQDHDHDHNAANDSSVSRSPLSVADIPVRVWGFAILAVSIISLVGLVSVAIIPVMRKVFYNHLLQFLVALAIGSLTGDAMLHLIPHSMVPHEKHEHGAEGEDEGHSEHDDPSQIAIWKGATVLAGVYIFFIAERLMTLLTDWKRNNAKKRTQQVFDTVTEKCDIPLEKRKALGEKDRNLQETVGNKLAAHDDHYASCQDMPVMMVHSSKGVKFLADDCQSEKKVLEEIEEECSHKHQDLHEAQRMLDPASLPAVEETAVVGGGHGHSHHHGHSHDLHPSTSISSIAWMVIMGDGLHNLSDGLAIGAAFANGVTGGLSTSIAVFCHELPHELGDFAVLLQAGMPAKKALFYNVVSSILCFIGMVIGVLVGNIESASLWIFALTGGMFIYISLVDMLPEITHIQTKPGEGRCCHLLLQTLGMSVGISIMLVIALFEHDIAINLGEDHGK